MKKNTVFRDIIQTIAVIIIAFGVNFAMQRLFQTELLASGIFVLAIFLIALTTNGYWYGLAVAPVCVLCLDYAFNFPYYNFDFTITENIVSAGIMIAVTLATSTLTTKIKKQEKIRMAAEKEKMRADLLRAISHDLRTPLTTIFGSSSTIMENYDMLPTEQKIAMLGGIKDDADGLIRMVENLLSITKLDNSNVELIKSEVVLEELVDSVLTKLKKRYPDQKVELNMPDEFVIVLADAILVEQVLVNLLENAVEHAEGMTKLKLNICMAEEKIVFEVEDDGCGIDKEKLKSIFDGYYMSEETPKDSGKRHMGIGLSVCSAIIRAHGGQIRAENKKSSGMIFRFLLDLQEVADE